MVKDGKPLPKAKLDELSAKHGTSIHNSIENSAKRLVLNLDPFSPTQEIKEMSKTLSTYFEPLHSKLQSIVQTGGSDRQFQTGILRSEPNGLTQQWHTDVGEMDVLEGADVSKSDTSNVLVYGIEPDTHMWIRVFDTESKQHKIIRVDIPVGEFILLVYHISLLAMNNLYHSYIYIHI